MYSKALEAKTKHTNKNRFSVHIQQKRTSYFQFLSQWGCHTPSKGESMSYMKSGGQSGSLLSNFKLKLRKMWTHHDSCWHQVKKVIFEKHQIRKLLPNLQRVGTLFISMYFPIPSMPNISLPFFQ